MITQAPIADGTYNSSGEPLSPDDIASRGRYIVSVETVAVLHNAHPSVTESDHNKAFARTVERSGYMSDYYAGV